MHTRRSTRIWFGSLSGLGLLILLLLAWFRGPRPPGDPGLAAPNVEPSDDTEAEVEGTPTPAP